MKFPERSPCAIAATVAFLLTLGIGPAPAKTQPEGEIAAGIGCAIDGDSILLNGARGPDGRCHAGTAGAATVEIRLHGIDAPEWRQTCERPGASGTAVENWNCGKEAAAAMAGLVDGRAVRCQVLKVDAYRRRIAKCESDGLDVQRELVRQGLAVAYRRYSQDYVAIEAEARAAKRGIWAGRFTWPERWRRENRP